MKRFPINKKIGKKPYVLGLTVNIGYIFIGFTVFLVFILLVSFSWWLALALVILDLIAYGILSFVSEKSLESLKKKMFAIDLEAIRNKSLAPFKYDSHNQ